MLAIPLGQSRPEVDHVARNGAVGIIGSQMSVQCEIDRYGALVFSGGGDFRCTTEVVETGKDAVDLRLGHASSQQTVAQISINHRPPGAYGGLQPRPNAWSSAVFSLTAMPDSPSHRCKVNVSTDV